MTFPLTWLRTCVLSVLFMACASAQFESASLKGSVLNESGKPLKRLHIQNAYTPIWWYADYPNHYAGEGSTATKEYGKLLVDQYVETLARTIKAIKADKETLALQEEFYNRMLK